MSRRSIAKREGRLQTNCSQSDFLTERQLLPKLTLTFASGWSTSEADVTPKSSMVRFLARRTGAVDPFLTSAVHRAHT
jgi:hypothetical protein